MQFEKSSEQMITMFADLVVDLFDVERRTMFGYPTCFINGNMCMGLHGNAIFLRLGPGDISAFMKNPGTKYLEPMEGRPMKGYVVASAAMLADRDSLMKWIEKAQDYTRTLPPKAKKK